MFKLLKNLKDSNYYYYEDFEEEDQIEADEKAVLADKKSLNGAVQSVDEMTTRLDALKNQVELLKKSNGKETQQLKKQLADITKEKESLELKNQVGSKTNEFYKNLESTNKILQKQLDAEAEKVKKLQSTVTDKESTKNQVQASSAGKVATDEKVAKLEEELATTKRQLIKYIKHEKPAVPTQIVGTKAEQQEFTKEMKKLRDKLLATKEEANILFSKSLDSMRSNQSNNQQAK